MGAVVSEQAGVASGINNAVSRAAGLIAIAVFGVVMLFSFSHSLPARLSQIQLDASVRNSLVAQSMRLGGIEVPGDLNPTVRKEVDDAIASSLVHGFRLLMFISMGLALASGVSAWILIKGKEGAKAE